MDQLTVLSNQRYHFAKEFYLDGKDITSNAILHAQQAAQIVSFIREVIRPVLSIACCDNGDDGFCQVSGLRLALILPGC